MSAKLYCYNRGCGQEFEEDTNTEESCRHHPGFPYFHDAYKGWSCCHKKSVDFTEFLNIKGCVLSKHSNVKPPEPEKPVKEKEEVTVEPPPVQPIIKKAAKLERASFESPLTALTPKISESFKKEMASKPAPNLERLTNLMQEVSIGTKCLNKGCEVSYESPETNNSECVHHPGVPIFHEGMKYWSCCQRKTSDFTTFMSQKGCNIGRHCWIKEGNATDVKCRMDWHQTGSNVVVTVYAKLYDYKSSFVKINPVRLNVELVFPEHNNNKYILDIELQGIVEVRAAKVSMMGSKVEIILPKAELGTWPKLEISRKIKKVEPVELPQEKEDDDSDTNLDDLEPISCKKIEEISEKK